MSTNLANIYANLCRKYGEEFAIVYSLPPTYLCKMLSAQEKLEKIVFFYMEDRGLKALNFVSPTQLNIKKPVLSPDEHNLTGSPLKDDCVVDAIVDVSLENLQLYTQNPWKLDEECHKGINLAKARAILCSEEFQRAGDGGVGSVWVLCNSVDSEDTLLLQYEYVNKHFSRGLVTFMGVTSTSEVNAQSLLKQHFGLIRASNGLETSIENTYHIKSNMALRCTWTTSALQPALIDLSSACDVVLAQTFLFGSCGPLTQHLLEQLRSLMTIRNDIIAYKRAEGKEPVYRCGYGIEWDELRESINKVMTEVSGFGQMPTYSELRGDIETVLQHAKSRTLTDLTDQLWDILKSCSTYKDLKMAFNVLFQCAARCNIVNTPTSKNRLAEIITEVANRRLAIPCLTGSEPLELLLEIGLEKLYKDYEYIFAESKICSESTLKQKISSSDKDDNGIPSVRKSLRNAVRTESNQLTVGAARKTFLHNNAKGDNRHQQEEEVIGFKNSNFNKQETAEQLGRLLQIHCTLEHLLMLHVNLNLSSIYGDVCEQLLKKPTRLVDVIDESHSDEMEITLAAHEVRDHLKGKDPHIRRIVMKSKNALREVRSTFYYSMENIFPPSISESFKSDDKEFAKENVYYGWLYRKIKTLK